MLINNKILFILLFPLLLLLTMLYGILLVVRHLFYDIGFFRSEKVDTAVISIGNITVGGTGKSPTAVMLINELKNKGFSPSVITRGYKRKSKGMILVHDGKKILVDPEISGDEPFIIASSTCVPVVCDSNRLKAADHLIKTFAPTHIILDDAFQHRRIKKDKNIVLIDERRFLGNRFLLPLGILRDCIFRLKAAEILILSKVKDLNDKNLEKKINYLKKFCNKVLISRNVSEKVKNRHSEIELNKLADKDIVLFCGIGDPENFYRIFKDFKIINKLTYNDHHDYNLKDISDIMSNKSDYFVTTEKDFVKLPEEYKNDNKIFFLELSLEFYTDDLKRTTLTEAIGEI